MTNLPEPSGSVAPSWPDMARPAPASVQHSTIPAPAAAHGFPVNAGAGPTRVSPWGRLGAWLLEGLLITVTLGIGWLIWAATTAGTGQTPAKKLLGQQVIAIDTLAPVGMGRMFWMRGFIAGLVASVAIPLTIGVLIFMPFWDSKNQNLWDKVSATYVVRVR